MSSSLCWRDLSDRSGLEFDLSGGNKKRGSEKQALKDCEGSPLKQPIRIVPDRGRCPATTH